MQRTVEIKIDLQNEIVSKEWTTKPYIMQWNSNS